MSVQHPIPVFITILLLSIMVFPVNAYAIDDAEATYRKQCGTCHGNNGDGRGRAGANLTPPASSFIAPSVKTRLSLDYMEKIIRDGKPGTAMVGYGRRYSAHQITQLAQYIRDNFVSPKEMVAATGASEGKQLYVKHCSACHGDKGNTAVWAKNGLNPPPRNFTTAKAREELSRERMLTSVTYGRPGTAMMPFKPRLSDEEIESVVDFIRQAFMLGEAPQTVQVTAPPMTPPPVTPRDEPKNFPKDLVGDWQAGEKFYMNNCFTCHGKKGDGKGPRAHFNRPAPRDFTSLHTAQNFDRLRLFNAIRDGKKGSVMPAWGTVLDQQQIANVAEFVYLKFIKKKN